MQTDDGRSPRAILRWQTSQQSEGSSTWLPGDLLQFVIPPNPTVLEYLNWTGRDGSHWSLAFAEGGEQFTGTRRDANNGEHKVRGYLQDSTSGPAATEPPALSQVLWTYSVELVAWDTREVSTAQWGLLFDDGSGGPPESINWLDRAGNYGSLNFSDEITTRADSQPETFKGSYQPIGVELMNITGRSTHATSDTAANQHQVSEEQGQVSAEPAPRLAAPVTTSQWQTFLTASAREQLSTESDEQLAQWSIQRGMDWYGNQPATEAELRTVEARLGNPLPPSYRNFLLVSNGWSAPVGLYGALDLSDAEFGPIRETVPRLVEAWADLDPELDALLNRALLVGHTDRGTCWLLDPADVSADGEWAAYLWWCGDVGEFDKHHDFGALAVALIEEPD